MAPPRKSAAKLAWLVPGVVCGGLVPLAVLLARALSGSLGAEPVAIALNQLGLLAFALLIASLTCTPLKILFGWAWPIRIRKTLGLLAFSYVSLHFLTYFFVDRGLDLATAFKDITERPFIALGATGLLLLIPLAITSTKRMLQRLGAVRWRRLHRLAYVAAILGAIHFVLRNKTLTSESLGYAAFLGFLLAVRVVDALRTSSTRRRGADLSAGRS